MVVNNDVQKLSNQLSAAWDKKQLPACKDLLTKIKLGFIQNFMFMPTDAAANPEELKLARQVLEIGALYSVQVEDIPAFERYMAQLKTYYFDYSTVLQESPRQYQLLGLYLLCLLSQNRVAEFHTELELLPVTVHNSNPHIHHPIQIEQNLMMGSYNNIFNSVDELPCPSYRYFMDILLGTVRNEIASCTQVAYNKISLATAKHTLFLKSEQAVKEFTKTVGWTLSNDGYYHFTGSETPVTESHVPSTELAQVMVSYAKEMEKIV